MATAERDAGRQLQPRHAAAARGRRASPPRSSTTTCSARPRSSSAAPARRRRLRPLARRGVRRRQGRRGDHHEHRQRLQEIERYAAGRILYTRFNYTTGDAAGQNLTGKATQAACRWILSQRPEVEQFFLESNFATDKKSSQVNMLRTRGKKVIAEATIPDELFRRVMRVGQRADVPRPPGLQPRRLHVRGEQQRRPLRQRDHRDVHRHRAGRRQRRRVVGGVRLCRAARQRRLLLQHHDPVADRRDVRRRTGLPTQRECLEVLGCYGTGKVEKLAEIVAATVLCGELSLGSAIVAEEWVDAHDLYGRNRPCSALVQDVCRRSTILTVSQPLIRHVAYGIVEDRRLVVAALRNGPRSARPGVGTVIVSSPAARRSAVRPAEELVVAVVADEQSFLMPPTGGPARRRRGSSAALAAVDGVGRRGRPATRSSPSRRGCRRPRRRPRWCRLGSRRGRQPEALDLLACAGRAPVRPSAPRPG